MLLLLLGFSNLAGWIWYCGRNPDSFQLAGSPAYGGKIIDAPGEQIVTWDVDGTVRIYACPSAEDSPAAQARYDHPYYAASLRLWAMAYNRTNLGGL